jgi:tRNA nucleotidyltransferase/poly(A) polymerase
LRKIFRRQALGSLLDKNPGLTILFDAFEQAGKELFFIGGVVRDYFLGIESKDIDLATSARPEETEVILAELHLPSILIGQAFGTIGTLIEGKQVEITTYRSSESYTKGSRKPEVVWGTSIEEDLSRRDFTFNCLAMNGKGVLFDPFNGLKDLQNFWIRCPIDPNISFADDPLRILRAFRFVGKLHAIIAPLTLLAIERNVELLSTLSVERIFEEFSKILMVLNPAPALRKMGEAGIFRILFPEVQAMIDFKNEQGKWHSKPLWEHVLGVVSNSPQIPEIRWSALMHDIGKPDTYTEVED